MVKYNSGEIRKALDAWYEARADERQEQILRDYFAQESPENMPRDIRIASVMFSGLGSLGGESLTASLKVPRKRKYTTVVYPLIAAAAAAVLIVILSVRRPFYGYDYDGSRITSRAEAMESAGYLQCLTLLDDDIFMISEMIK
ncbi:MAG: hypothetical protein MJY77_09000 [Bacteroidaceae bacterium]|nr:hypothetical protein [Bacteroidaceae bacterium]